MLEEPVPQIARDRRAGERDPGLRREGVLDGKGSIRQARALRLRDHGCIARGRHGAPGRRQHGQHRAVAVALRYIGRARMSVAIEHIAQTLGAGEIAVQVVECAVLRVDHDDGGDLVAQGLRRCIGSRSIAVRRGRDRGAGARQRGRADGARAKHPASRSKEEGELSHRTSIAPARTSARPVAGGYRRRAAAGRRGGRPAPLPARSQIRMSRSRSP